jgi:preprotein translocase subunit SecD
MYKVVTLTTCVLLMLIGHAAQARQARGQFSIRAASDQAIRGWAPMEFDKKVIWVSPIVSITPVDIVRAVQMTGPDGRLSITVTFTDDGAQKVRNLSAAQMNKFIVMVLNGKVVFAPRVRSEMSKEAQITGDQPTGLSAELANNLLAAINDIPNDLPR